MSNSLLALSKELLVVDSCQAKKRLQERRARIKHSHEESIRSIEEAMNSKFDEISRRLYVDEQSHRTLTYPK